MKGLFTSKDVCGVIGISYRQLDYWIRRGFVRSSVPACGSGSKRGFLFEDLLAIYVFALYKGSTQVELDRAMMWVKAFFMGFDKAPFWVENVWLVAHLATEKSKKDSDCLDSGSWLDSLQPDLLPIVGRQSRYGQAYKELLLAHHQDEKRRWELIALMIPIGRIAQDLRQRVREVLERDGRTDET